jgi:hypothetical protein
MQPFPVVLTAQPPGKAGKILCTPLAVVKGPIEKRKALCHATANKSTLEASGFSMQC